MMIRTENFFIALGHWVSHHPQYKSHHRGGIKDAKPITPVPVPISQQTSQVGTGRRSSVFGANMTKRGRRKYSQDRRKPGNDDGKSYLIRLFTNFPGY